MRCKTSCHPAFQCPGTVASGAVVDSRDKQSLQCAHAFGFWKSTSETPRNSFQQGEIFAGTGSRVSGQQLETTLRPAVVATAWMAALSGSWGTHNHHSAYNMRKHPARMFSKKQSKTKPWSNVQRFKSYNAVCLQSCQTGVGGDSRYQCIANWSSIHSFGKQDD